MNKEEIHRSIARNVLRSDASMEDVLLFMLVLCRYRIRLRKGIVLDDVSLGMNPVELWPLTHWGAADAAAAVWSPPDQRATDEFWHSKYQDTGPYQDISDVPSEMRPRFERVRDQIVSLEIVDSIREDL